MKRNKNIDRRIICVMFFTSLLCSSALGQAPKGSRVAASKKPTKAKCSGAWTGVVTFTRTHRQTNDKTTPRVSGRGTDNESYEIKGDYSAQVVVREDAARDGGSTGTANVTSDYKMIQTVESVEKNSCDRGKTWKDMKGSFSTKTQISGSQEDVSANVSVGVSADGTYRVGVAIPQITGKANGEQTSTYSGQCTAKEGKTLTMPETEKSIDGHSLTSDGRHRVDPKNADQLSGSYSFDLPGGVVETIMWDLRRCGGDLMITDVKFYQPLYPSPHSWIEIKPNGNTIDGNMVKVVATVVNLSGQSKQTLINFKELKEGVDLPEGKIQLNLDAGEEREVPYTWDTSGYAWKAGNPWSQPEMHRQIEVTLANETKTRDIQVRPKPVVVVPGLWSNPELVFKFLGAFKSMPALEWTAELARVAISKTAAENAPVIDKTVRDLQKAENAWHVDLVAHSTGGLMARRYIQDHMPTMFDGRPVATQLVMLGTPNMGTPCSTGVENIFTKIFSRNQPSFSEVSIKNMKEFNKRVKSRNGTKFSIIVGNAFNPICQMDAPGDGITPNRSAIWTIKEWKFSTVPARHENMLGHQPNFNQIVTWLGIPPKGDHKPDYSWATTGSVQSEDEFTRTRNYGAAFRPIRSEAVFSNEDSEPDFSTGLKLPAGQTSEVAIPVKKGSRLSVTFLAPPNVSATLLDANGNVAGRIVTGTPEAEGTFRTITVKKEFESGTWKLRLESTEQSEAEIVIIAFVDYSSNVFAEP